jgi:hypothetical protein
MEENNDKSQVMLGRYSNRVKVKVKQSRYRSGVAQRDPGS